MVALSPYMIHNLRVLMSHELMIVLLKEPEVGKGVIKTRCHLLQHNFDQTTLAMHLAQTSIVYCASNASMIFMVSRGS